MKYITLKDTDLNLSNLCLGTAGFGEKLNKDQAFEILDAFVRRGGNFIDTANVYCRWIPGLFNCSEKILGEWLKSRRAYNDVVIATKGAHYCIDDADRRPRVNERDIREDLEDSLHTLGLDVIDFYWLHRDDPARPIEEIIDILEKLKSEGKIRFYGLSNYKTDRISKAKEYLEAKGLKGPYGVSNQWSLAAVNPGKNTNPDPTLVEFSPEEYQWHVASQTPVIPFSSTAMGFFEKLKSAGVVVKDGELKSRGNMETIPGPLRDAYWSDGNLRTYERLLNLQNETGHSLQALSAAYLLNQPFQVIPVGSARTTEQLEGFLEASDIVIPAEKF